MKPGPYDRLPDVRDGLNRLERLVILALHELDRERPGRMAPIAQIYGRVREHVDVSIDEVYEIVQRLVRRAEP
jgi:DNA gyrase/topoisomerase IV subunit A